MRGNSLPMEVLFGGLCFLVSVSLVVGTFGFWIWMLVDCLKNEPSEGNDKLVWVLVIVFLHFIGAAIYYVVRRPERIERFGR